MGEGEVGEKGNAGIEQSREKWDSGLSLVSVLIVLSFAVVSVSIASCLSSVQCWGGG